MAPIYAKTRSLDVGMAGNGAIAGLVAITAPSGYVEFWAAPIIGAIGGVRRRARHPRDREAPRRPGRRAFRSRPGRHLGNALGRDLRLRATDPRGCEPRHLVRDHRRRLRAPRSVSSGCRPSALRRRSCSCSCSRTRRSRRSRRRSGSACRRKRRWPDWTSPSHGMYGYPEQFIPQEEFPRPRAYEPTVAGTPIAARAAANGPPTTTVDSA